jgi:YD repeat-containing protein
MRVYNADDTTVTYAANFVYDGSGALHQFTMGNGQVTTLEHDAATYQLSHITSGPLDLGYEYFLAGNVKKITDARPGMTQQFTYDPLDRLATMQGMSTSISYEFDAHGNRQTSGGVSYEYEPANPFRLKNINGAGNYQYALNGNLMSETAGIYNYTVDNLLDSTTLNYTTTRYAYDGQGWRIRMLVEGGPIYYYARGLGGELLSEWMNVSTTNARARDYIYAEGRLLGVITKSDLPAK